MKRRSTSEESEGSTSKSMEDQIRDSINEIINKNPEQKRLVNKYENENKYNQERCLDTLARLLESERENEGTGGKKRKLNTRPCICLFPDNIDNEITLLIASNYDKTWHDKKYVEHLQEFISSEGDNKKLKEEKLKVHVVEKVKKTKVWEKSSVSASKLNANLPQSEYDKFINAISSNNSEIEEFARNAWDSFDSNQKKENLEPLLLILDNKFIIDGINNNEFDSAIVSILESSEFKDPTNDNELLLKCEPGKKMYHPDMKMIAGIKKIKEQKKNLGDRHYIALSQLCCEACYQVIKILQSKGESFGSRGTLCGKFYKNWTIPTNVLTDEGLKELHEKLENLNSSCDKRDKIDSLPISTSDLPPGFQSTLTDQYNTRTSEEMKKLYQSWETQTSNIKSLQTATSSQNLDSKLVNSSLSYSLVAIVSSALIFCLFWKWRKVRKLVRSVEEA